MRKVIVLVLVAMLAAFATAAFAQNVDVATGEGKNASPTPDPVDPTADLANQASDPLFIGADDNGANGVRAAVAVGDEGQDNSLGRVGVAADGTNNTLQVYGEDYTSGDQLSNTVEDLNQATGCVLIPPDPAGTCADESNDDAVLVTIS